MSIIESLSMFFWPTGSQVLQKGIVDPWLLLLAALAAFITAAMAFLHRPLEEKPRPWFSISVVPINALTLTVSIALVQFGNVLDSPAYQALGFQSGVLWVSLVVGFGINMYALRYISLQKNSPVKIAIAAALLSLALAWQNLMAFMAINHVALFDIDNSLYFAALGVASAVIALGVWYRFSTPQTGFWHRHFSQGLFCGICFSVSSLVMGLSTNSAVTLVVEPSRNALNAFTAFEMALVMLFLAILAMVFNFFATSWLGSYADSNRHRERETHLSAILSTVTDAVVAIDRKGNITYFNTSAERIFGWEAAEVLGKNVRLLVTDEHQHRHDMYIHNYLDKQGPSVVGSVREVTARRRDGSYLPVRLSIGHRETLGEHEFVAVIADISEQRNLTWALRENAKQYRALVANLPCMAFREMTGAARHIVYISDAAKSLTGYSASILTGENGISHFVDRIHTADLAGYRKVRELASRRNGKYDCEYRFLTRDDEQKWFWEIGHSYRAEDGSTWIDGVIVDVTEKHEAEEAFEEKMRLAEKATQSKASFLANMSYEFRSPMNSILGLTDVLMAETVNPAHRHHLEVIRESGNGLLKLINDILDTSKLESQSLPLDIADFSLVQLCRQIEFIAHETVQARDLHVSLHYNDGLWEHYVGDARRIKQLLQNMMRSALTKTEKGSVALHVLPTNDMVRFAVASYSLNQPKGAESDHSNAGQTLSATLVTQLIELMNGHLWFDGESIHGSVVYADLPLIPAQSSAKMSESAGQTYVLPPLEVLVIDDVQRNQQELRDMLLRQGVKVLTFTDLSTAEDVLKTQPVDVVFLDAYLGEGQYPTPSSLRSWAAQCRDVPLKVVAMKLTVDPTTQQEWRQLDFDDVIEKPFIPDEVFRMLATCCGETEEDEKVTVLNPTANDIDFFDDGWAFVHWPTTEILLSVIREYRSNYMTLPTIIRQQLSEQPDALEPILTQARDGAQCIGFPLLERQLDKILAHLETGDVAKAESKLDALETCLMETFDRALAYLGVRANELEERAQLSRMSQDAFEKKTEIFVSKLSEGQYDDDLYKELVPMMAGFVPPTLLSQFVASVESFELDEAYRLILAVMAQLPLSQNTGVQGYGV